MDENTSDRVMHRLKGCLEVVRQRTDLVPEIAVVLGSGLGDLADHIQTEAAISYAEIPGFPTSTVAGHRGRFVFGYIQQVPVVLMQGRVHYYEGYQMTDVVLPVRLMGLLGARGLVLTNAAGGVNPDFHPGDFMLITDHIATAVPNPLIGRNPDALGPRFPDMSAVYSPRMREAVRQEAERQDISLREGVYVQLTGPSYETPAEIRMCRMWGGDAVGMSTACEAVAARHMGMEICGISCITNMAAGISGKALSHAEVEETAGRSAVQFQNLITAIVPRLQKVLQD